MRERLIECLGSHHDVVLVVNGFDAICALNRLSFDAYVVDYFLPDWNGWALCREIRKRDAIGPICCYSACDSVTAERRMLRAGADAYFRRSSGAVRLAERLDAMLQFKRAAALRGSVGETERNLGDRVARR